MSDSASSPAQLLKQLSPVAVIGSDRAGAGQTPARVLGSAARAAVLRRAGQRPGPVAAQTPLCPADARPVASDGATAILERLLNDPDADVIEEWAGLAKGRGRRVADGTVPRLISWWARQPRRSEDVFAVMGQRGSWLASLNPDWRKPVAVAEIPANADELWNTGTGAERMALLISIRRHDPARALALVRSTWSTDGADERKRFVDALAEGRSMADEPFLEAALDDRSKTVRRGAAALLARIPGSRLKARLTALARGIIVVEKQRKGLVRRESVTVSLKMPQDFEAAWDRDGIEETVPGGKGKRAWWMLQILRDAEIGVWGELTGLEPAGVLENFEKESTNDAVEALTYGAAMSGDGAWAAALVGFIIKNDRKRVLGLEDLWGAMNPDQREGAMLEALSVDGLAATERWTLLAVVDRVWPYPFSVKAMGILKQQAPSKKTDGWHETTALDRISKRLSPRALDAFEQAVSATFGEEHIKSIQEVIDQLRLRAEMHKEFEK